MAAGKSMVDPNSSALGYVRHLSLIGKAVRKKIYDENAAPENSSYPQYSVTGFNDAMRCAHGHGWSHNFVKHMGT